MFVNCLWFVCRWSSLTYVDLGGGDTTALIVMKLQWCRVAGDATSVVERLWHQGFGRKVS